MQSGHLLLLFAAWRNIHLRSKIGDRASRRFDADQRAPLARECLGCNFMGSVARRIDLYQDIQSARGR